MRIFLIAAVLLSALTSALAQEQASAGRPATVASRQAYEQILVRYAGGDFERVARDVGALPAAGFSRALDQLRERAAAGVASQAHLTSVHALGPAGVDLARDDQLRLDLTAMLLHTEAALHASDDSFDGHLAFAVKASGDFDEISRRIVLPQTTEGCLSRADAHRLLHDWAVLAVGVMHVRSHLVGLPGIVIDALARDPKDPALSLAMGVYYERAAGYSVVDESLIRQIYAASRVSVWRHSMETAIDWLAVASSDPVLAPEAHLRMGRIHQLLGDAGRARAELEPLLETSSHATPVVRYLALMMAGRLDQGARDGTRAESRFEEALALFPSAQAPMLALSQLREESGAALESVEWVNRSFGTAHLPVRSDPWWAYGNGPLWDVAGMQLPLRRALRR